MNDYWLHIKRKELMPSRTIGKIFQVLFYFSMKLIDCHLTITLGILIKEFMEQRHMVAMD